MNKLFKYILFCLIATLVNLGTQRIIIGFILVGNYLVALIFGTVLGLFTKYFLDKFYIFDNHDITIKGNSRMFTFYSFNGIFTTSIFWVTESLFYYVYKTTFARELGALIGLSIGYIIKYQLDKKYVFEK